MCLAAFARTATTRAATATTRAATATTRTAPAVRTLAAALPRQDTNATIAQGGVLPRRFAPSVLVPNPHRRAPTDSEAAADKAQPTPTAVAWANLGLPPYIVTNLEQLRLRMPSAVQLAAIPALLSGRDAVLQAATGTGKTLAYLLPVLARIDSKETGPQSLIVVPTRELAAQVANWATDVAKAFSAKRRAHPVRIVRIVGELPSESLRLRMTGYPAHVLIGTPVALQHMLTKRPRPYSWAHISSVVLDEVDHLVQPFTKHVTEELLTCRDHPKAHSIQRIVVSATITPEVEAMAKKHLQPNAIRTSPAMFLSAVERLASAKETPALTVEQSTALLMAQAAFAANNQLPATIQHVLVRPLNRRPRGKVSETDAWDASLFRRWFAVAQPRRVLVFCASQGRLERLAEVLKAKGFRVGSLSGETKKDERMRTLRALKTGVIQVVLSTEMASRGLDLPELSHVYNFDVPPSPTHYIHRAGRVGRLDLVRMAPRTGTIVTPYYDAKVVEELSTKLQNEHQVTLDTVALMGSAFEPWSDEKHLQPRATPTLTATAVPLID